MRRAVVLCGLVLALVSSAAARPTSDTTITFDDLDSGTEIANQYESQGVRFGEAGDFGQSSPGSYDCGPPTASDDVFIGERVAWLSNCNAEGDGGPHHTGTYGAFAKPKTKVAVRFRSDEEATEVEVDGFDAGGRLVAEATDTTDSDDWVTVTAQLPDGAPPAISYFAAFRHGKWDSSLYIDDLTFDNPALPISVAALPFTTTAGRQYEAVVAHVTDPDTSLGPSAYDASIDWGDGQNSGGTVTGSGGSFDVHGAHAYAVAGSFTFHVAVTKNGTTATAQATATVNAPPDFALALSPQSVTVEQGAPAVYTVTVSPAGGFAGTVALSATPAGGSFSTAQVAGGGSATLTYSTASLQPGTHQVVVTGTSGALSHTASATLVVNAPPQPVPSFRLVSKPSHAALRGAALLNGALSHVASGRTIVQFAWDFDGNGAFDTLCGPGLSLVYHPFLHAGSHSVRLRITDSTGARAFVRARIVVPRFDAVSNIRAARVSACADPGPDGFPGSTDDCTRSFEFGIVEVLSVACFRITARNPYRRTAGIGPAPSGLLYDAKVTGKLRLNGLFIPLPSSATSEFDSQGLVRVGVAPIAFGPWRIARAPLDLDLANSWRPSSRFHVGDLELPAGAPALGGLPFTGRVGLDLADHRSDIAIHVGLPPILGGVTGDVTVHTESHSAFVVDNFDLTAGGGDIAGLFVRNIRLHYRHAGEHWDGGATFGIPPAGDLDVALGISGGRFAYLRAQFTFPVPGLPLGSSGVFLDSIDARLATDPDLAFGGGVNLHAGPRVDTPWTGTCAFVQLRGEIGIGFGDPAYIQADGDVRVLCLGSFAHGYVYADTNGAIRVGVRVQADLADVIGFSFELQAFLRLTAAHYQLWAPARVCIKVLVRGCGGGEIAISDRGIGVCVDLSPLPHMGGGVTFPFSPHLFWSSCDITTFLSMPNNRFPASAGARGRTFELPDGLPGELIAAKGLDAPPRITVTGPHGERYATPPGGSIRTDRYAVFPYAKERTTYMLIGKPSGGTWRLTADLGSVVVEARRGNALPEPQVSATLAGKGFRRTLRYRIMPIPGQSVRFTEEGRHSYQELGQAAAGAGTIAFTPSPGGAGLRRIVAYVSENGNPRTQITVASYTAPARARLDRPNKLRVTRTRAGLLIRWLPVSGASGYVVRARLADGRRLLLLPRRAAVRIAPVSALVGGVVSVAGLGADNRPGLAASVAVKAAKPVKAKPKQKQRPTKRKHAPKHGKKRKQG